jgi:hypothetical protein
MSNIVATLTAVDEKWEPRRAVSASSCQASENSIPYWNVNVPPAQWTTECPSFLRNQSEKNISILSTPDEQYRRQGWELVRHIVGSWNRSTQPLPSQALAEALTV